MKLTRANIRELKSRLSYYLRLAKAGQLVEIAERGVPIGRIVPQAVPIHDRLEAMGQLGLALWNKRPLKPLRPVPRVQGKRTVADLLIDGRQ